MWSESFSGGPKANLLINNWSTICLLCSVIQMMTERSSVCLQEDDFLFVF